MTKKFLYRVFCGFFLGISVFAPGFSGSVIAIAMGIYQDIVRIISNPFKKLKENIIFCIPIGIGVAASGVLYIIAFSYLFSNYEKATYLLFLGLITGNLPVIYGEIKKTTFKKRYLFGAVPAFVAALGLGIIAASAVEGGVSNISSPLYMFALGGFFGGAVMLIPGMSVSVVLIITGGILSQLIFAADSFMKLDFTAIIPVAVFTLCAITGLVLTSKGIKNVFNKFPGLANTTVFGFMVGSLLGIAVQSHYLSSLGFNWFIGGGMLLVGLLISMGFVVLAKRMNTEE